MALMSSSYAGVDPARATEAEEPSMTGFNLGSLLVVVGVTVVFFALPAVLLEHDRRQAREDGQRTIEPSGPKPRLRSAKPIASSSRRRPAGSPPAATRSPGQPHIDGRTAARARR